MSRTGFLVFCSSRGSALTTIQWCNAPILSERDPLSQCTESLPRASSSSSDSTETDRRESTWPLHLLRCLPSSLSPFDVTFPADTAFNTINKQQNHRQTLRHHSPQLTAVDHGCHHIALTTLATRQPWHCHLATVALVIVNDRRVGLRTSPFQTALGNNGVDRRRWREEEERNSSDSCDGQRLLILLFVNCVEVWTMNSRSGGEGVTLQVGKGCGDDLRITVRRRDEKKLKESMSGWGQQTLPATPFVYKLLQPLTQMQGLWSCRATDSNIKSRSNSSDSDNNNNSRL